MSDRLTSQWTKTAEQAFGVSGRKGRVGEELVTEHLRSLGFDVIDYEEDKLAQVTGIDLFVGSKTLDVKANLKGGRFCIEPTSYGWLFNPKKKSDIIVHVDLSNSDICWYYRDVMKKYIRVDDMRKCIWVDTNLIGSYAGWASLTQELR